MEHCDKRVAESDTAAAAAAAVATTKIEMHEASRSVNNKTETDDGEHETHCNNSGTGGYICSLCVYNIRE